jgi:hypothetical protein
MEIKFRTVTFTTGDPPICEKHKVSMNSVMIEFGNDLKETHECDICNNTQTREVLFEKHNKFIFLKTKRFQILKSWLESGLLDGLKYSEDLAKQNYFL